MAELLFPMLSDVLILYSSIYQVNNLFVYILGNATMNGLYRDMMFETVLCKTHV